MASDSVPTVAEPPTVDYPHLPGEEANPLMESTAHVDWSIVLLNAARHALAGTGRLVTGNVPFAPGDGGPHTAPDVMVIPGAAGRSFGRYEPGPDDPMPMACVEILSPSNTRAEIERRCRRLLRLGVAEVYVLDPERETVVRVDDVDSLVRTSAIGTYSPGLGLSFVEHEGHLTVCCPAGRTVSPGDDAFGWLIEEREGRLAAEEQVRMLTFGRGDDVFAQLADATRRADEAEARRIDAEERLHALEDRLRALERPHDADT
jgi:Uma2 family endonuclease